MPRGDRIELAIIVGFIVLTLISFFVFAVDPLGIIVLVLLLIGLGLFLRQL